MAFEVFQILNANFPENKPSEGFNVGRTLPDGKKIAKCNLNRNPGKKGMDADEVINYINQNYPQPEIEI